MIPHHADHPDRYREALASSSNMTTKRQSPSSTQTDKQISRYQHERVSMRWLGASIIRSKLAIPDDVPFREQQWFRKVWEKRH